jgi:CheY-like chemotaxis protein
VLKGRADRTRQDEGPQDTVQAVPVLLSWTRIGRRWARTESALLRRFGPDYEAQSADSAPVGLDALERLARGGSPVALVADLHPPEMDGVDFLDRAHALHRDASRVPLVTMDQHRTHVPCSELKTLQRVNDKRIDPATGERKRFCSAILPPWCRKTPKIAEVLPLLYLHGLSGGDFVPALEQFLGTSAGLSAATVTRLTAQWQDDYKTFSRRDLSTVD